MKHKVFLLFVALLTIVTAVQAQAYDFYAASPNGQVLWYKINSDNVSVTVVSPLGEWPCYPNEDSKPAGNVIIPDTVYHGGNTYAVTNIGNECFRECPVTSLHIPATYTGDFDEGAFLAMPVLSQITVDPANPVYDSRNNCNAIIHTSSNVLCKGSASTVIPNGITSIRAHAFYGLQMLTSIVIPSSVSNIDYRAFCDCINMTSVTFQDGNNGLYIGFEAFMHCHSLATLYIPSRVIGLASSVFCCCWSLASITVDPANLIYDSRDNCNAIIVSNTNVLKVGCINTTIPTSVTKITPTACIGNHNETNAHIVIPDWVTGFAADDGTYVDFNTNAFAAQDVADVTFPAGWENFDVYNSAWYSGHWQKIIFLGSTPPVLTRGGNPPDSDMEGAGERFIQVEVPCGSLATWQAAPGWSYFPNMSEPGVPQITVNAEHGTATVQTYPTCGNDTATVIATADANYHFVRWSDGSTQNPYTLVLNGNTNLSAQFAIDSVTVTVATADATKGSVIGGGVVPIGGYATVTAVPTGDNIFLSWSNGITTNPYTLTVTTDTTLTALFTVPDIIVQHDTTYVPVHDTTYVDVHDTTYVPVHDTTYIYVHDTTYVPIYDIEYVNQYVHDTTFVNTYVHDTTIQYVNNYVHDTTLVNIYVHDTTIQYVNNYVHDTTLVNVYVHDTTIQYVNNYVHDTAFITNYVYDTIIMTMQMYDTTIVNVNHFDTTLYNNYQFDTTIINYNYLDTVFVRLHDTIYVTEEGMDGANGLNAKIYSDQGQIVVEGAEDNLVMLYDVTGRMLATKQDNAPIRFDIPANGTYMIKIGNYSARRVVVVK